MKEHYSNIYDLFYQELIFTGLYGLLAPDQYYLAPGLADQLILVNTCKLLSILHYLYVYTTRIIVEYTDQPGKCNMDTARAIMQDCNKLFGKTWILQ